MQRSLSLLCIGTCAGLVVLFGTIFHRHTHLTTTVPATAPTNIPHPPITAESYGRLPLSFEQNQGQVDKQVAFLSHGPGYNLFLTPNQAVISLHKSGVAGSRIAKNYRGPFTNHVSRTSNQQPATSNLEAVLRLKLLGANTHPQVTGLDELPGNVNYFIGNDPKKWRTHVPTYSRVSYKQVYPGIDMVYYGNQKQLEYDWVVAPGADVHTIQIGIKGAEKATLTSQGDLQLHTINGDVIQHAPIAYQEIAGTRKPVSSRLVLLASSETMEKRIGFEVAVYDHTRPLVIDPILVYSTYLGGSGIDYGFSIAVDSVGNAYVCGSTSSVSFPTEVAFQSTNHAPGPSTSGNVFISVMNASGTALIYSTYLGGSGSDRANGIALDSSGNAYVTGQTFSTDFPTQNPYQSSNHTNNSTGGGTAFVTKFNSTGSALVYSTYLGGSGAAHVSGDEGFGIAVDSSGHAYVCGNTTSADFPIQNPLQSTELSSLYGNAFVTKFNSTGSALIYSTYLGGATGSEDGYGIAVDGYGNAYISGDTSSTDFLTQNPLQATSHGDNAFIARIGNYNWQTVDVTVGSDNLARLLWINTNHTVGLWSVNNSGQASNLNNIGPFTGYTVQATAAGADGLTRMLWNKTDGTAALWLLNANNTEKTGFNFGPYAGWTAVDITVGSDNKTRMLWTKSDGTAGVWTVDGSGNLSNLTNIGPYTGWTASRIAAGSDGYTRLLWTKNDGTVGVWLLNANNTYKSGFNFGPYTSWRGIDIAVGSDNKTRLLWNKSDGTAGVWTVDNNGVSTNLTNVGPYTGWTATKIASGADGYSRMLWFKGDGTQGLWLLNSNNTFNNGFNFGPY